MRPLHLSLQIRKPSRWLALSIFIVAASALITVAYFELWMAQWSTQQHIVWLDNRLNEAQSDRAVLLSIIERAQYDRLREVWQVQEIALRQDFIVDLKTLGMRGRSALSGEIHRLRLQHAYQARELMLRRASGEGGK